MALKTRKPRQSGPKGSYFDKEFRWLSSDVREQAIQPWGAIAWPRGEPDAYMPDHKKAAYRCGEGSSICGVEDGVKRLRRTWADNRDEILPDFVKTHPGRRPCGFWLMDAPPGAYDYIGEDIAALTARGEQPPHESQASFLRRHGLLLPGEAQRLAAEDFEPEDTSSACTTRAAGASRARRFGYELT